MGGYEVWVGVMCGWWVMRGVGGWVPKGEGKLSYDNLEHQYNGGGREEGEGERDVGKVEKMILFLLPPSSHPSTPPSLLPLIYCLPL